MYQDVIHIHVCVFYCLLNLYLTTYGYNYFFFNYIYLILKFGFSILSIIKYRQNSFISLTTKLTVNSASGFLFKLRTAYCISVQVQNYNKQLKFLKLVFKHSTL